jgi:hypothetical protein
MSFRLLMPWHHCKRDEKRVQIKRGDELCRQVRGEVPYPVWPLIRITKIESQKSKYRGFNPGRE